MCACLDPCLAQVKVKRRGDDQKFLAEVLAIGTECDIALLTVRDDAFWAGVVPLQLGPLPRLQVRLQKRIHSCLHLSSCSVQEQARFYSNRVDELPCDDALVGLELSCGHCCLRHALSRPAGASVLTWAGSG